MCKLYSYFKCLSNILNKYTTPADVFLSAGALMIVLFDFTIFDCVIQKKVNQFIS